ncbi:MAG: regulatory protein GemA [Treponema sp.]|jgi:hypothetical protein|nr:regulatory protein GemA [Treponema sp.]
MTSEKKKNLIKLVHIGKAKLGFDDDAYRAFLEGVCGKNSSSVMTVRELEKTLKSMRRLGFNQIPNRVQPEEKGGATLAQLEYIKGMWAVCARNKSDAALLAFVYRVTRVKALRLLTVETARDVILALREMMFKAGFDPDTSEKLGA